MLQILVHSSKSQILGPKPIILGLREHPDFKLRHPGHFHMIQRGNMGRGWDGFVRYITEGGLISTGLLPKLLRRLEDDEEPYEVIDKRGMFKDIRSVSELGGLKLRPYQLEAVNNLLTHQVHNLKFPRGILWEATNAGKNLIAAAIFSSFSSKRIGLFLINNTVIFQQAVKELKELLGNEVGEVSSKKTDWRRVNVCMVQTLCNRAKTNPKIRAALANCDIIIVDEGDEVINRKDAQYILTQAHNAPVRVSLTGTSGLNRDKLKNLNETAYFGPVIHKTTNKQLVDQGYSAKPDIVIYTGNSKQLLSPDYQSEYQDAIIYNKSRNTKVWKRALKNLTKGRGPVLILIKYHEHIKQLLKVCPKVIKDRFSIKSVHHETKNREQILEKFKLGKIDILICSMIIRRGKNLPLMRTLINASGGDSQANVLQILGRGLRLTKGLKEEIRMEDFYDRGRYLRKHAAHRVKFYKGQGFPVRELYLKNKNTMLWAKKNEKPGQSYNLK